MNASPFLPRRRRARLSPSMSASALALFSALAATSAAQAQDATEVETVEVVGYRQSLQQGADVKRRAGQVLDVITAEEFGKFPEQNVAEAIQRVPGVSMTRNNGEGDEITIRGLEPDLTRLEINGRSTQVMGNVENPQMASTLTIFGADQFARIEVVKSPQARDTEGGVGGTVRLITARPLDVGDFAARMAVEGRYNSRNGQTDPKVSGMVSHVFANGQIGVLFSGSYDDRSRRIDQHRNQNGWMPIVAAQTNGTAFTDLNGVVYSTHFDQQFNMGELPRANADLTLQYRPSDAFEVYFNASAAHEDRQATVGRLALNLKNGNPRVLDASVNEHGTVDYIMVRNALFTLQNRGFDRQTESYGVTLEPKWTSENWTLTARVDYSDASQTTHDRRIRHRSNRNVGYDARQDPKSPILIADVDLNDLDSMVVDQNLMEYGLAASSELSYQFDAEYRLNGFFSALLAGVKVRNYEMEAAQGPAQGPLTYTFADAYSAFPLDDFFKGEGGPDFLRVWPYVDARSFVDKFGPSEADSRAAIDPALAYSLANDSIAGYVQANFDRDMIGGVLRGNVGVRVVADEFDGRGTEVVSRGGALVNVPVTASSSDINVLPALNLSWTPNALEGLVVRAAAGRVMTRPRFNQMNPTATVNEDTMVVSRGNPDLKPFLASQYDLGVEYYYGESRLNMLSAAVFYKDIENFTEPYTYTDDYVFPGTSEPEEVAISSFRNGGSGRISGVELSAQMVFDFLPSPLDGFGAVLNYTYIDSARTLATGQDVEIPGNSPHTVNAILFYEKGPISLRTSYNFRDTYLKEQFGPRNNTIWVDQDGRLDVSVSYEIMDGLKFVANAVNVLNENRYEYADQPDRMMLHQLDGRFITFGIGYSF